MKVNSKVFEIWVKYLVYSLVTAIAVIGKTPFDFTSHDWHQCVNAVWVALVPVIIKWANPNDELTLTVSK